MEALEEDGGGNDGAGGEEDVVCWSDEGGVEDIQCFLLSDGQLACHKVSAGVVQHTFR